MFRAGGKGSGQEPTLSPMAQSLAGKDTRTLETSERTGSPPLLATRDFPGSVATHESFLPYFE